MKPINVGNRRHGFTIIEVLVVLAVAGVIMLVVFMAVPALQRMSRNNTTKNEASSLAAAYLEVVGAKGTGVLAASWSDNTTLGDGAVDSQAVLQTAKTKNIIYLSINPHYSGSITYENINFASNNRVSPRGALIRTGAKCAGLNDPTSTAAPSIRQIAVYETPGGNQVQCIDS
jgi:prepilin-type N-terminal cleavage/methylation domain-containing protein